MTRYEILATHLSNMLHEQLGNYENKLLLMEPADILDNAYDYVIKSNLVSTVDNMLESEQLDEDEIITLINKSPDDLYDFYYKGFNENVNKVYCNCIADFCIEAKEK